MKKFVIILGMVFWIFTFVGCNLGGNGYDLLGTVPLNKKNGSQNAVSDYVTITVVAELKAGHTVAVRDSFNEETLSGGQCIKVRVDDQGSLVVSVRQNNIVSQLCSSIDEDKNNNCKGNYNVVYKGTDPQTGASKLALELADRNENKDCIALWSADDIYTITVVTDLGNKTMRVQNNKNAKTLRAKKGSCLKLTGDDFGGHLQIDVGEGDYNRRVLCRGDSVVNECNKTNYEINVLGQPPEPDHLVLNPGVEYNNSESCVWFNENSVR